MALEERARGATRPTAAFPAFVGAQGREGAAARPANVGHALVPRGDTTVECERPQTVGGAMRVPLLAGAGKECG